MSILMVLSVLTAGGILCSGYGTYPGTLDPNAISVVMGLPFAAVVLPQLARLCLPAWTLAVLPVAIAAYSICLGPSSAPGGKARTHRAGANVPRRAGV